MSSADWRGTVGVVKPTYGPGSLVEFIRLLPEGVGVLPLYVGFKQHTQEEYLAALDTYDHRVAELAGIGCDVIHPEGAPPFILRGYKAEQEIIKKWEEKYQLPVFTSGSSQIEALQALGIKRFVGVTYYKGDINDLFARYFREAGFQVLAMEGMPISPGEWHGLAPELIYTSIKKVFLKYPDAEGIYLLGSGAWQVSDVLPVEYDLQVPIVHPVAARILAAKKRLHIRQPMVGMGRLLGLVP